MPAWRIVFMGTPEFAVPTLERLLSGPHEVVGVFTQPDKPVGRGMKLTAPAVKKALLQYNAQTGQDVEDIALFQPARLRDAEAVAQLRVLKPDLVVVVAYGQILSSEVLDLPCFGCINVHASLLPRWRGAAPIQRALLAGDRESGVTIMQMDVGLDTGPMLNHRRIALTDAMTGGELHDQMAQLGADLLADSLPSLQLGTLKPQVQSQEGVTYAAKLKRQDGKIDWQACAVEIKRQIFALNPWPVAYTQLHGKTLKIFKARIAQGLGEVGQVVALHEDGLEIACSQGSLVLTEVQLAGKRRIEAGDWLRGYRVTVGEILG